MEVRPNPDMRSFLRPISVGMGREPEADEVDRFAELLDPARAHSAFVDGEAVGSIGAFTFELTVPGGSVPAAGATLAGVLPSHRRRGVLSRLMHAQLKDVRRRKEPVACLWTSEERIYGRFGYGLASLGMSIDVPTHRAGFRDDPGRRGQVRLVDEAEAAMRIPPLYDEVRRQRPGMVSRSEAWWRSRRLVGPSSGVLFRAIWEEEAYALYRVSLPWFTVPHGVVNVEEAIGVSFEATREIWRYLFTLDLVERVKAYRLPLDHPLLLMLEEPRRLDVQVLDNLWIRLVDVEAAFAARARGSGAVIVELADRLIPANEGRWRIGHDTVERVEDEPDLMLDVADLASVYLGAFTFAQLAAAGRVREARPEAAARADQFFGTHPSPWCPEIF